MPSRYYTSPSPLAHGGGLSRAEANLRGLAVLDPVTEDPQASYTAARLTGTATLPKPVLPSPLLHPAEALVWYLSNPLLLARWPAKLAATRAAYEAGSYSQARVAEVAQELQRRRNRLSTLLPMEPADAEAKAELLDLCAHPALDDERTHLRRRVFGARASEYSWLREPLEAAIKAARPNG